MYISLLHSTLSIFAAALVKIRKGSHMLSEWGVGAGSLEGNIPGSSIMHEAVLHGCHLTSHTYFYLPRHSRLCQCQTAPTSPFIQFAHGLCSTPIYFLYQPDFVMYSLQSPKLTFMQDHHALFTVSLSMCMDVPSPMHSPMHPSIMYFCG